MSTDFSDIGEALARDDKEFGKIDLDAFRENQKARAEAQRETPRQQARPPRATPEATSDAPKKSTGRPTNLARALEKTYERLGAMLMIIDQSCGSVIIDNAGDMATSLDELAKTNPKIKRALESMIATSAWGNVAMAHMPVVIAISMHHSTWAQERMARVAETMAENVTENAAENVG